MPVVAPCHRFGLNQPRGYSTNPAIWGANCPKNLGKHPDEAIDRGYRAYLADPIWKAKELEPSLLSPLCGSLALEPAQNNFLIRLLAHSWGKLGRGDIEK